MLRKIVLKILKATAKDITITHHYTHKKFMLNSYNHKGYWYHGKKREEETVAMFKKWISKDNYVLEIDVIDFCHFIIVFFVVSDICGSFN